MLWVVIPIIATPNTSSELLRLLPTGSGRVDIQGGTGAGCGHRPDRRPRLGSCHRLNRAKRKQHFLLRWKVTVYRQI